MWLPAKEGRVEVATFDQYSWAVRRHIVPLLGAVRLRDLSAEVVDAWIGELRAETENGRARLGPTTARLVRKVLSMALEEAVQRGRMPSNPVALTQPPRPDRTRKKLGWTLDEARQFLRAAAEHRLFAAFHLGLVTGLRRGEVLALRWADVDLKQHELEVVQQLSVERGRPVLKQLKTEPAPTSSSCSTGPAHTGTRWPPCRKRPRSLSPGGSSTGPPRCKAAAAIIEAALGRLNDARRSLEEATALAGRAGQPIWAAALAQETMAVALDEGLEELAATRAPLITSTAPSLAWARGSIYVWGARVAARLGREDDAIQLLGRLVPWLEHAPAWAIAFAVMACHAAEVLWLLERTDHIEVIDRALREKVVAPDFRTPMVDGRLALARLSALQGRDDEALKWLAEARQVLGEQGALSLLAIADFDEVIMYLRWGGPGAADRARPLLDSAIRQFSSLGMSGWVRRAE